MKTNSIVDPKAMAVALGRWCVGMILLVSGVAKVSMGAGAFAQMLVSMFENTRLPKGLLIPYGYALPFIEVILGAMLILGLWRNCTLFVAGLFFISLTFGQLVLAMSGQRESISVVFQNMIYTFLTAGLLFLHEQDRWVIGNRKKLPPEESP